MNITIIEANMTGTQHSYHNSICVRIFSEIAGNGKVDLYCSREHLECMGIICEGSNISFHEIEVVPGNQHMIKKFLVESKQTFKILNDTENDIIIFLSSCPDIQYPIIKLAKKYKNKKIVIMTHGELEGLVMSGKWKPWSYPFWISLCFKKNLPSNIYRIVLAESIKDYIDKQYDYDNIYFIDQPRDGFQEFNEVIPMEYNNKFGYIGDCSEAKGGYDFLNAAKLLGTNSESELWVVGRCLLENVDTNDKINILSKDNNFLTLDTFNHYISKLTYACFPYPNNCYQLTASGAVLDAVRYLKPIVYIKNEYFDGIFKDAGDIGYRCNDAIEFCNVIKELDENPNMERYHAQVKNLKSVQKKFAIDSVKHSLDKILRDVLGN